MIRSMWELSGVSLRREELRARVTLQMLDLHSNDLVLDIGCGDGFITRFFIPYVKFVVGVDCSIEALKIARRKIRSKNVDFVLADATMLPFKSSAFDKISVLETLEHLKEPVGCIKEIDRCAKSGASLIISVPYQERRVYTRCIHCGELTPLWGHLHSFDLEKIFSLLPKGYSTEKCVFLPNIPRISLSTLFRRLPFRVWLPLNNLLGVIKKGYWIVLRCVKLAR